MFLPYMSMVAILVLQDECVFPRLYEQNFIYSSNKGSISNFTSIRPAVSEKKMFEIWNLSDLGPRSLNGPDLCYP